MKKLWQRRWLVVAVTVAVFLSVGAAAWATTNGSEPSETTPAPVAGELSVTSTGAECDGDCDETVRPGPAMRKALREKAEKWAQRHGKLMEALRGDMTPADQALYDQLVQKAKEQREALQNARNDLMDTLKQVRDLADKYLSES